MDMKFLMTGKSFHLIIVAIIITVIRIIIIMINDI